MDCGFDWLRLFWRPATPSVIKRDFWGEVSSQHSSASVRGGDSGVHQGFHWMSIAESPNLTLLTKAHLAQLIDLGVGGRRADKELDCLVDNSFAAAARDTDDDTNRQRCQSVNLRGRRERKRRCEGSELKGTIAR